MYRQEENGAGLISGTGSDADGGRSKLSFIMSTALIRLSYSEIVTLDLNDVIEIAGLTA